MKKSKRNTIILLSVAIVLVIIALISRNTNKGDGMINEFAVVDTAGITKVFLADKAGNEVTLERLNGGKWRLNNSFTANNVVIESLLNTMFNLEVKGIVQNAARNTVINDMSSKSTKVEIYQRKPLIKIGSLKLFKRETKAVVYYVGGPTPDHLGTFMRMEDSEDVYVTYVPGQNAFLSLRYSAKEKDWRDHTVFALNINDINEVSLEKPDNIMESFMISRKGGRSFEMTDINGAALNIPIDTLAMLEYLASFRSIKFEGLINDMDEAKKDSILKSQPLHILTIKTFDNKEHKIRTYKRKSPYKTDEVTGEDLIWDRDRLYVYDEVSEDLSLCQYYVFDKILRTRSYFDLERDRTPRHEFFDAN